MLFESVGIGIVISLVMTEWVGIAAGGIVVPGYFAYMLHEPFRVVATLAVSIIVLLLVKLITSFTIIYGRRLLVLSILLGYIFGTLTRIFPPIQVSGYLLDLHVVGYVIPGLVAYWMQRQGAVRTISALLLAAVLTRCIVIIFHLGNAQF